MCPCLGYRQLLFIIVLICVCLTGTSSQYLGIQDQGSTYQHERYKYLKAFSQVQSHYLDPLIDHIHLGSGRPTWLTPLIDGGHLLLVQTSHNVSEQCAQDVRQLLLDLYRREPYAIRALDALAKPESGILQGNLKWMGSYDSCQKVDSPINGEQHFRGQYCQVTMDTTQAFPNMPLVPSYAVCVPNSCSNEDTTALFNIALHGPLLRRLNISASGSICATTKPITTGAIVAISVCGVVALFSFIGTLYYIILSIAKQHHTMNILQTPTVSTIDASSLNHLSTSDVIPIINHELGQNGIQQFQDYGHHNSVRQSRMAQKIALTEDGVVGRLLLSFSFITNSTRLFNTHQSDSTFSCLYGLRFFSMTWVILGHTFETGIGMVDNIAIAPDLLKKFTFQAVSNATFSVDTFFLLSGMLVTYHTVKHLKAASGHFNWALFYFHRFWRLSPTYLFVLMIWATLFLYLPRGPLQRTYDDNEMITACYQYWWTNLIYINNFIPGTIFGQCMGWSWYLAVDTQFYIISPIFLYLLFRRPKIGLCLIVATIGINFILTGVISRVWQLLPGFNVAPHDDDHYIEHVNYIYQRFYHRIASYMVGMLLGYALYVTDCKLILNKFAVTLGWIIAVGLNILVLYGLYPYAQEPFQNTMSLDVGAFYLACSRFTWCMGVAWLILACVSGYGGPINAFLSLKAWVPLGRLTFCAYLVHPFVGINYFISRHILVHYTDYEIAYIFIGNVFVAYSFAYIVSMMVEAPMMAVEKIIFGSKKNKGESKA